MNNVRIVEVTRPPITTIARGREVSEPIPVEVAAGIKPMAAIMAVIITGLMRATTPERIAASSGRRSCRFFLNFDNRITLFWMHIPNKAINPIPAEMLKFVPVRCKAVIPPIIANGTLSKISPASVTFPNNTNRMKKIRIRLIGTTIFNLREALC
jgi:hypothetical protein